MTRFEYDNTVRDLLGDASSPSRSFPSDDVGALGFATAINTSELSVSTLQEAAEGLAGTAVKSISKLVPCVPTGATEEACAGQFVAMFGRRAFRRPPSSDEAKDLMALYRAARGEMGYDFAGGIRVLVSAILQSPQFLYRGHEAAGAPVRDSGFIKLDPFERASRLSYFLWASMPDDGLLDAAAANKLESAAELIAQAKRLLADARARDAVGDFFSQVYFLRSVLQAEKDTTKIKDWDASVRASALAESLHFVQTVVLEDDGLLRTLMTADFSFLDARLAQQYGVAGVTGTALRRVSLPEGRRSGLLTQASFLASESGPADGALITPIKRGKTVRTRVLCQEIPPPMANIVARPSNGVTVRERLASHASDPQCAVCHHLMDPLGYAFEHYDVVGRWRDADNGRAVDTTGAIEGLEQGAPRFDGATDMLRQLVMTKEASDCMVRHVLRYGSGREETPGEVAALRAVMGPGDLNVRDTMLALIASKGFTHREAAAGEVVP